MRRAALFGLVFLGACASSPAMREAKDRDFGKLKADLVRREAAGTMSNAEARDLAKITAERELATAKGDDAVRRVREVLACASDLDGALADRAKTHDAAGGEAALTRVEDGEMGYGAARDYKDDKDDAWRAVGARGLVRGSDRDARLHALADASPAVRRSAVRAAREADAREDFEPLFEAARVDPDPMVRTEALRVIAKRAGARGGVEVANKLRDLWTSADDAMREDIAVAFASRETFEAGGRDALRVILAQTSGPGAIAAAGAIFRTEKKDAELTASARALLVHTIANGSRRDRLHAIALSPTRDPDLLTALRAQADDGDLLVRVAVLSRLATLPKDRDVSVKSLETIAGDDTSPRVAASARFALANLGDVRVQSWLEADLTSPDPIVRTSAAGALAALGRGGRAAPLLGDEDPSVRTRVACTLLASAHTHR